MTTILPRRGTAAEWTAANPVLAMGELGYETDTKKWKRGDGTTAWNALDYNAQAIPTVMDFGAVADGVADDASAFAAAAALSVKGFRVPAGVYRLDSSISLGGEQIVYLDPGARIKAGAQMTGAIFDASGVDGVQIIGNGAIFDLNNMTDRAIRIGGAGDGSRSLRCAISGVYVIGRSVLSDPLVGTAAIELKWLQGPLVQNIQVDGFGSGQAGAGGVGNAYSLGLFNCTDVKLSHFRVTNGDVGLEIYQCDDAQISQFSIRDCVDNGIYILSGSSSVNLAQGRIDNCEEGIVIRSDDVTVSKVKITNCTNKGVSLRIGDRTKIDGGHFEGNNIHIGDDGDVANVSAHLNVSNSTFRNAGSSAISLVSKTDIDFDGISVYDTTATYTAGLIRLNKASRCVIRNSRFNNPGKTIPIIVRLSHDTENATLLNNVFVEANIAINLFDSSGLFPTNTNIVDNRYLSVTSKLQESGAVTGTVTRESGTQVDKTNTAAQIYATDSSGNPTLLSYFSTSSAATGSVITRGTNGRIRIGDGTASTDAATKGQVDAGDTAAKNRANHTGTQSSDFEITDATKGVILKSPDGTRYRITVANGGTLTVAPA